MRLSSCYRWRALVLVLLLLFAPASLVPLPGAAAPAQAPQAGKVYRIGFLRAGPPPKTWVEAFQQGLQERGYIDGQNVVVEFRSTAGAEVILSGQTGGAAHDDGARRAPPSASAMPVIA